MNYQTLEDNSNMKRSLDYKNKLNQKEMNFKELFKPKNKKEKSRLNQIPKKKNQLKNMLNNSENKSHKMKKPKNKILEIVSKKEKKLKIH